MQQPDTVSYNMKNITHNYEVVQGSSIKTFFLKKMTVIGLSFCATESNKKNISYFMKLHQISRTYHYSYQCI